jgi:hypothetical protein
MDTQNGSEAQPALQRQNSVSQVSENSQTAQEYVYNPAPSIMQLTIARFIESQLLLEAEAREALPYVCVLPTLRLIELILFPSNSIHARVHWAHCAKVYFPALLAIRPRPPQPSRTELRESATLVPSLATANTIWSSCSISATSSAIVAPRDCHPRRHARCV